MTSRLLSWFVEGGPSGDREVVAYAAGSLAGIALATLVLALVVGASLVG